MGSGGARPNAGRKKKKNKAAVATIKEVEKLASKLSAFMDAGLELLGHEVPELISLEIDQARQAPYKTVTRKQGDDLVEIEVYDKDIARLSQTSRHFLLKFMTDMMSEDEGSERTLAAQALRKLVQIQVEGDLVIGQDELAGESSVLVEGTGREIISRTG